MSYRKRVIISFIVLGLLPECTLASRPGSQPLFQRDPVYEQALHYQANADHTITPAKVLRWIMDLRGQPLPTPSPVEFQPIVNVRDSHLRVVAVVAYKF